MSKASNVKRGRLCWAHGVAFLAVGLLVGVTWADTGLVAHYPMDGDADDVSGNENHGIPLGAELTHDRNGVPDSAYQFSGDDYIDCGADATLNIIGDMTVAAWVKIDSVPSNGGNNGAIIGKFGAGGGGSDNQYEFAIRDGKLLCFQPYLKAPSVNIVWEIPDPEVGVWYHVAATFEAASSIAKLYFNGDFVLERNLNATPFGSSVPLSLGATAADGPKRFLVGCLDDVRIYCRALDATEIEDLQSDESDDSDGDGVPDESDACVDSDLSPTVVIGGCDSGVENVLLAEGCTIADSHREIIERSRSRRQYVIASIRFVNSLRRARIVSRREAVALIRCALRLRWR